MNRTILLALLALGMAAPSGARGEKPPVAAVAAPSEPAECAAPDDLVRDDPRLPRTARHLRQGKQLRIVAVGGASTAGSLVGGAGSAYPARLQLILSARYPKSRVTVVNLGRPHQTADQEAERFAKEVIPRKPTLVIWETGTYDAVQGVDPEGFAATLHSGIEQLHEHGIDVLLVDPQYAGESEFLLDVEDYQRAMARVADIEDAYLFRRHALMRYWSANGVFDYAAPRSGDYAILAARVYQCLAFRLAEAVAWAVR